MLREPCFSLSRLRGRAGVGAATHADVTWGTPTLTLPRNGGRGNMTGIAESCSCE
jgi:hypothetical protein